MHFNDKVYNVLKFLALVALPALGAFYFALAGIWGLPAAEQVQGTVLSVDTLLGVLLGISTKSYNNSDAKYDGKMSVSENPDTGMLTYSLDLNGDPVELKNQSQVVFKVQPS